MNDPFWSIDPIILVRPDRLIEFFPRQDQSNAEQLNAITRLGLYISIILCLYHKTWKWMYVFLLFLIITQLMYIGDSSDDESEHFEPQQKMTEPTLNNPFMNPSIVDIADNPKRPPAQMYYDNSDDSKKIRENIDEKFNYNLYKDVSEVFGNTNSQRQFYTTPSTTYPNDREAFQKWCYGDMASCKDNNFACVRSIYEDPRYKQPEFYNPDKNPVK